MEKGASHTDLKYATKETQNNQGSHLDIHSKSTNQQYSINDSISHLHDESVSSQDSCDVNNESCG